MRFAFYLCAESPTRLIVELFDASTVSVVGANAQILARITYEKNKKWTLIGTHLPNLLQTQDVLTIKKIVKANLVGIGEATESAGLSPLIFLRALIAQRSVQVAYDPESKRFRCVTTMKDGANSYEVVGTSLTVEAKDDEMAVRLAKRAVTECMQEKPELAEKLVAFFSHGCKVKKIASGAVPEFIKIETLAINHEEEKIAKTPVKLSSKQDEEE